MASLALLSHDADFVAGPVAAVEVHNTVEMLGTGLSVVCIHAGFHMKLWAQLAVLNMHLYTYCLGQNMLAVDLWLPSHC